MPRTSPKSDQAAAALQAALDAEMAGVALYTHLALRVHGPQMHGIVAFLRSQAAESLKHAETVGDRMVRLGAVPVVRVSAELPKSPETLKEILALSLAHERGAVDRYRALVEAAAGDVPLEEFARTMVATEADHAAGLELMLRPMA